ncbi:MAG: zinc metalloprotease HtpX [Nitrospiraceae bacterium]
MNRLKTVMLLATLTALMLWFGFSLGGQQGLMIALVLAGLMNVVSYWWSDKIALRMHRAQPLSEEEAPELHDILRTLAQRANIPTPALYLIPEQAPNAFATGRNPSHAAVAVTAGLTQLLSRDEITGVMAHELGHVKNRDTLIMTVAATLAGALTMLARFGMLTGGSRQQDGRRRVGDPLITMLAVMLAPVAAALIQMAISRSREFLADDAGAEFSRNPLALAQALRKISGASHQIPMRSGSPATAHLFIMNPLTGGGWTALFSTHPPVEQRIARLEAMAGQRSS